MRTETTSDHRGRRPGGATPGSAVSRHSFLVRTGGVLAAALVPKHVADRASSAASEIEGGAALSGRARADQAFMIRVAAARAERALPLPAHPTNGDEARYPTRIGSFCKALPCDQVGIVDSAAYQALLQALSSGEPDAFDAIPLAGSLPLTDPQAAYAFLLEGSDAQQLALDPAPAVGSAQLAAELAEDYWMALARDVPFAHYNADPLIAQATADLSAFSAFRGPAVAGAVTPSTLFRGPTPGDLAGPFLSQFLWLDVPYGTATIPQRYPAAIGNDFLTTSAEWLRCQRGLPPAARLIIGPTARYLSCGRDLASYVHGDFAYQAYLNAALILLRQNVPLDAGNPYRSSRTQRGFATFGAPHVLDLVARAANAALKAAWYQKWLVHRRVRPEALAGCVHHARLGLAPSPLHPDLLTRSAVLDMVYGRYGSYLLPQAYPEGCPCHPSYPAAHAAIAGACVTLLKAFFDEVYVLPSPVEASADGTRLHAYRGAEALSVGGELNKLASNIALGRDMAGVHWRSDGMAGLALGEAVAQGLLRDQRLTFHERFDGFSLTTFDGTTITV